MIDNLVDYRATVCDNIHHLEIHNVPVYGVFLFQG